MKISGMKEEFLFKGGRLTLIRSTLVNLPIYYIFLMTIPIKVAKKLESIQCGFLWGDLEDRKYIW